MVRFVNTRHVCCSIVGVLALTGLIGCGTDLNSLPRVTYTTTPSTPASQSANTGPIPEYDRDYFPHWSDLDGDGCNTMQEIRESAVNEPDEAVLSRYADGCVKTVRIRDPYTGVIITGGRDVQIDHVVAICEAWKLGAYTWTQERREQIANDPDNLIAVRGSGKGTGNASKGCQGPATWRPQNHGEWCDYGSRITRVKERYQLPISDADKVAIRELVSTC